MADDIWTSALKCTLYREGRHLHPSFLSTLCTWMNGWMDGFVSWPSRFRSTWRVAWLIAGRKQSYSGLLLSQHFCDFEVIQEKYKVMNESLLFAKAIETQWFVKTKTPGFISIKKKKVYMNPFPPQECTDHSPTAGGVGGGVVNEANIQFWVIITVWVTALGGSIDFLKFFLQQSHADNPVALQSSHITHHFSTWPHLKTNSNNKTRISK